MAGVKLVHSIVRLADRERKLRALLIRADEILSSGAVADGTDERAGIFCVGCGGRSLMHEDECPACLTADRIDGELYGEEKDGKYMVLCDNCGFEAEQGVVQHKADCPLLQLRAEIVTALRKGRP